MLVPADETMLIDVVNTAVVRNDVIRPYEALGTAGTNPARSTCPTGRANSEEEASNESSKQINRRTSRCTAIPPPGRLGLSHRLWAAYCPF